MSEDSGPTAEDANLTAEDADSTETAGPAAAKDQATIRGTVTYPWGNVVDAKIVVGERRTVSDNVGKYELSELTPGVYDLMTEASFPGYEKSTLKVEVAAGETKIVDVYLDFVKAIVDGHVYDQDRKPVVGAILSGVFSGKDMETAKTDEQGYFVFQRVTPGDRFIRVNASGYAGETRDFTAKESTPTTLEFRLTPAPCKVYGTVTDASGKPLRAEMLLLKSGIVIQKTYSDAENGHYEFPMLLGIYEILPMAPGYGLKGWHGSISADTQLDFNLEPAPQVQEEGSTH